MSAFFIFEINKTRQNKQNLQFFKGRFSVMSGPMDITFGVFSEANVRLLNNTISQFFSKYSKSYNMINVKSFLKLNGP